MCVLICFLERQQSFTPVMDLKTIDIAKDKQRCILTRFGRYSSCLSFVTIELGHCTRTVIMNKE